MNFIIDLKYADFHKAMVSVHLIEVACCQVHKLLKLESCRPCFMASDDLVKLDGTNDAYFSGLKFRPAGIEHIIRYIDITVSFSSSKAVQYVRVDYTGIADGR